MAEEMRQEGTQGRKRQAGRETSEMDGQESEEGRRTVTEHWHVITSMMVEAAGNKHATRLFKPSLTSDALTVVWLP